MIGAHDRQRGKVYAWEERFVAPYDPSTIVLAQAQGMVDVIWIEMGLCFPPKARGSAAGIWARGRLFDAADGL